MKSTVVQEDKGDLVPFMDLHGGDWCKGRKDRDMERLCGIVHVVSHKATNESATVYLVLVPAVH